MKSENNKRVSRKYVISYIETNLLMRKTNDFVNFISLMTDIMFQYFNPSLVWWSVPGICSNHGEILKRPGDMNIELKTMLEYLRFVKKSLLKDFYNSVRSI